MTFSIAARDGEFLGVAVASRFLAVGADVRVDDHPDAPRELARVQDLHELRRSARPQG